MVKTMAVLLASASIDEHGRASGGQAGDQTGREVYTPNWYASTWDQVIRAKSATVAEKIAHFAEQICANNHVGYNQARRNTLRACARAVGWDGSKIAVDCDTDCSAFATVCVEAAGVNVNACYTSGNAPTTWAIATQLKKTGQFDILTGTKYLSSDAYLQRGDILNRTTGHVVIVLTNGSAVAPPPAPKPAKSVEDVAKEVLAGLWGNGPTRSKKLTAAGHDAQAVQAAVNQLMSHKTQNTELLAMEVLAGQWGNEPNRSKLLTAAGYDAAAVQAEVNRMLGR